MSNPIAELPPPKPETAAFNLSHGQYFAGITLAAAATVLAFSASGDQPPTANATPISAGDRAGGDLVLDNSAKELCQAEVLGKGKKLGLGFLKKGTFSYTLGTKTVKATVELNKPEAETSEHVKFACAAVTRNSVQLSLVKRTKQHHNTRNIGAGKNYATVGPSTTITGSATSVKPLIFNKILHLPKSMTLKDAQQHLWGVRQVVTSAPLKQLPNTGTVNPTSNVPESLATKSKEKITWITPGQIEKAPAKPKKSDLFPVDAAGLPIPGPQQIFEGGTDNSAYRDLVKAIRDEGPPETRCEGGLTLTGKPSRNKYGYLLLSYVDESDGRHMRATLVSTHHLCFDYVLLRTGEVVTSVLKNGVYTSEYAEGDPRSPMDIQALVK